MGCESVSGKHGGEEHEEDKHEADSRETSVDGCRDLQSLNIRTFIVAFRICRNTILPIFDKKTGNTFHAFHSIVK